jgi:hypothetical protein
VINGMEETVSENSSERIKHGKEKIVGISNTCIGDSENIQVIKVKRL